MRPAARALPRAALAASIASALVLAPVQAVADLTKDQCIDANTQAQTLRRDGKLAAARAELQKCGDPSCPAMLRDDCSRRTDELEKSQPTVLFDAKDGVGHDLVAVKVTIDGQPFADRLEGKSLKVDPGPHVFSFAAEGQPPLTQTFVIKEGEKERRERIVFGSPPTSTAVPAPVPAPGGAPIPGTALPSTPPDSSVGGGVSSRKIVGLSIAGAGVAGIAVGSVFGLLTASAANQQKTDCASPTSCAHVGQATTDHSTAQTDGAISTIAFIAGGALLVGGAVLFFTGSRSSESPATSGLVVAPGVGPGGGGVLLRGTF